jgi:hypothetical protein
MLRKSNLFNFMILGVLTVAGLGLALLIPTRTVSGRNSPDHNGRIANGAGTTLIHGGGPGLVPVITTLAFHAERSGGVVTGEFDCLALAPDPASSHTGELTVNAMYVIGSITGATVNGDTATLTGTSTITGLGAGTTVPFTFVVRNGGPGASAVLTVNSLSFPFHEILVQGAFEIHNED